MTLRIWAKLCQKHNNYKERMKNLSFLELAKKRRSVRKYTDEKIDRDTLLQVVNAGRIAPSAVNLQPWQFIIIDDASMIKKISESYPRDWFSKAKAVIVICGDHSTSWTRKDGKDHCDIDAAIATDHMALAAADLGLGSCWVCAFDEEKCRDALELPEFLEPIVLLPLGYPSDAVDLEKHLENRKSLDEIVNWNKFSL